MKEKEPIEIEIKEKMFLPDGIKYLIFYLRKNNFKYIDIVEMIENLIQKTPYPKTLKSIYVSINNRLGISSTYNDSEITFLTCKLLMDLLLHQLIKLKEKLNYQITITMLNFSNYEFPNALKYVIRTEGKDLNFKLDIIFSYNGNVKGKLEQIRPTMSITFNEQLKLIEHLAFLEYKISELLTGD